MGNLEHRIITFLYSLSYGQLTNTNFTWVLAISVDSSLVVLPIRVWREEGKRECMGKERILDSGRVLYPVCVFLEVRGGS